MLQESATGSNTPRLSIFRFYLSHEKPTQKKQQSFHQNIIWALTLRLIIIIIILLLPPNYSFECDQSRNYDLSSHHLKHVNFRLRQR